MVALTWQPQVWLLHRYNDNDGHSPSKGLVFAGAHGLYVSEQETTGFAPLERRTSDWSGQLEETSG